MPPPQPSGDVLVEPPIIELSTVSSARSIHNPGSAGPGNPRNTDPIHALHQTSTKQFVIIVASSFTIIFTCCGLNFAWGVYQALYENLSKQPHTPFTGATPAEIDLIGTISCSLMTIGAPFSVAWAKAFPPRMVAFTGGFVFAVSLVLASFGQSLWHFELSQGVLNGLGTCLCYMVAVTIAPPWFTQHRGLAMGIILAGTGVGGLVWAPALTASVEHLGFRNTLRLTGAVSFTLISLSSSAMAWDPVSRHQIALENAARRRHRSSSSSSSSSRTRRMHGLLLKVPLVDWRVARSRRFLAQALGAIFQAAAYYTPVFFYASYAQTLGYSTTASANFIALSNACNAIGKVLIGYLADRVGRLNALFLTTLLSAIATVAFWLPSTLAGVSAQSKALFITFTVLYGVFASAYVSLFPASLVELFGAQNFASVNGVLYMVRGMATMIGTPVGGVLIRSSTSSSPGAFKNMSLLVSVLLFAATMSVLWVRLEALVGVHGAGSKWHS
ncbi:putative MFS monocarboxylate transporter [Aspergillus saccharolyticus JOP 1030-1]|uniref:MFS general substrate transporter n=1 Tax=Aspergillus saccharolyticus JOP 1030-1 TaxID=1450539 RepID=A0A318Z5C5_9EURO|nr:MFS general substrate transporter [Aspergillus saccharolyticus JOP 1030-1]PYH42269.1 MFS general substrate transporter [Aspergillus saccharolyticus JOP 1030-1]